MCSCSSRSYLYLPSSSLERLPITTIAVSYFTNFNKNVHENWYECWITLRAFLFIQNWDQNFTQWCLIFADKYTLNLSIVISRLSILRPTRVF